MAALIARGLEQLTQPVDWDRLCGQGENCAQALFNLPSRDHAPALKCPFYEIDSLRKYAERSCDDYEYPTERRLGDVGLPCLLITGDSDQVVNNRFAAGLMRRHSAPSRARRYAVPVTTHSTCNIRTSDSS